MNHRYDLPVDKSQCRCLADVVLLYIRYACPKLIGGYKEMQEYAEHVYTELVRGDIIGNPRIKAAGVVYVAAVMTSTYVTQEDVADTLGVNSVSVRTSYMQIKEKGKKQGMWT